MVTKVGDGMRGGQLDLYALDVATGTWSHPGGPAGMWQDADGWTAMNCHVAGRPGVRFQPHRQGDGLPLPSQNGALWIWYAVHGPGCGDAGSGANTFYRWTWGKFNPWVQDFNMGKFHFTWKGALCRESPEPGLAGGRGMALMDGPMGLEAFFQCKDPSAPPGDLVVHTPHADGQVTPPFLLADHDDHATIRATLCRALNYPDHATRCHGALAAMGGSQVPAEDPEVCTFPEGE
jgi:hypothetical protein